MLLQTVDPYGTCHLHWNRMGGLFITFLTCNMITSISKEETSGRTQGGRIGVPDNICLYNISSQVAKSMIKYTHSKPCLQLFFSSSLYCIGVNKHRKAHWQHGNRLASRQYS